jgi:hypothetical protein
MKQFKNDVTKEIEELRAKVADQESTLTQMRYNIEEQQKFIDPIIQENTDILAALRLCLPVFEAHTEASHLTDGFRPRENENDRILARVKKVIESAEGHTGKGG